MEQDDSDDDICIIAEIYHPDVEVRQVKVEFIDDDVKNNDNYSVITPICFMSRPDYESPHIETFYSTVESVLFMSIGNTCRSAMAVAILIELLQKKDIFYEWSVDSAALTELYIGELILSRANLVLCNSYDTFNYHRTRLIDRRDFKFYKYFFCIDQIDLYALERWRPPDFDRSKVMLLGDLHPDGPIEFEDPLDSSYREDDAVFHRLYKQIFTCVSVFLGNHQVSKELQADVEPIELYKSDAEGEVDDQGKFSEVEEEISESSCLLVEQTENVSAVGGPSASNNIICCKDDADKFVVPPFFPIDTDDDDE